MFHFTIGAIVMTVLDELIDRKTRKDTIMPKSVM